MEVDPELLFQMAGMPIGNIDMNSRHAMRKTFSYSIP